MAWGNKDELEPPVPGAPRSASSSPSSSGKLSFIGGEVTLTGNLSGQGDLHLDGAVEGDIGCNTLILGQSGRVKGNVTAQKATIGGTVSGTVNASTMIIEKSAKVKGDLTYDTITVENGASIDGRLSKRTDKNTPIAARTPPVQAVDDVKEVKDIKDPGLKLVAE